MEPSPTAGWAGMISVAPTSRRHAARSSADGNVSTQATHSMSESSSARPRETEPVRAISRPSSGGHAFASSCASCYRIRLASVASGGSKRLSKGASCLLEPGGSNQKERQVNYLFPALPERPVARLDLFQPDVLRVG